MNDILPAILLLSAIAAAGLTCVFRAAARNALDVASDLSPDDVSEGTIHAPEGRIVFADELGKAGLFTVAERRKFLIIGRLYPWIGSAAGISLKSLLFGGGVSQLMVFAFIGFSFGVLIQQGRLRRAKVRYHSSLEFFLPIVMERLVMAVQSGLDVLAAFGSIIELETESGHQPDPVTRLLSIIRNVTDRGLGFEIALREVAASIESCAVRHAFVHLAIAYREGGELVMPLKELSDATQLHYQETMDEQIAKLPVKATMPLLCTFAGLILTFITSPVIQLIHMAGTTAKGLQ